MRTPAGKECRFYYQNFHRGHSDQECRLIMANSRSPEWRVHDCSNCPVPDILLANSSPDLVLEGTVKSGLLGFNRRVEVTAFCSKHLIDVPTPHVGCPQCALEKPGLSQLFDEG
ncbi:MAG: hypothetical protein GY943_17600 [Chloroflexi bacterium]|nr:hypothetical protein [Chloroflexota bacterium]